MASDLRKYISAANDFKLKHDFAELKLRLEESKMEKLDRELQEKDEELLVRIIKIFKNCVCLYIYILTIFLLQEIRERAEAEKSRSKFGRG